VVVAVLVDHAEEEGVVDAAAAEVEVEVEARGDDAGGLCCSLYTMRSWR
jgi:hypothetical protein